MRNYYYGDTWFALQDFELGALRPCPFCGGKAQVWFGVIEMGRGETERAFITCEGCGIEINAKDGCYIYTVEEAQEIWNTRCATQPHADGDATQLHEAARLDAPEGTLEDFLGNSDTDWLIGVLELVIGELRLRPEMQSV